MESSNSRRPNGYWTRENTLHETTRFLEVFGEEHLKMQWMRENGFSWLANAITKNGGVKWLREESVIATADRKPDGYWTLEKIIEHARDLVSQYGEKSLSPMWLKDNGRYDLSRAIQRSGGFPFIREKLGIVSARKPEGHYTSENIDIEIREIIDQHGEAAINANWLRDNGYGGLYSAISKQGIGSIRDEYGLNGPQKQKGYWTRETVLEESGKVVEEFGEACLKQIWLKENGYGPLASAIQKVGGGLTSVREELGLPGTKKANGHWSVDAVLAKVREIVSTEGSQAITAQWLRRNGHQNLVLNICKYGGFDWIREELQLGPHQRQRTVKAVIKRRLVNLEYLRSVVRDLSLEGVEGFTPAQLVVLLQQAKFDSLPLDEGRDLYLALTQGLLLPQELLEWSLGEESEPPLVYANPELKGEPVAFESGNPLGEPELFDGNSEALGQQLEAELSSRSGTDIDSDFTGSPEGMPHLALMDPADQLRLLDGEIFASADDEAIQALISMGLHQLWAKAYLGQDHAAQVVDICKSFHSKRPWSKRLQELFLQQYNNAASLPLPDGFNYRVDGQLVEPRLMQRHVAAVALERRRLLVMSDMGTGKSLAAQLAVMADGAQRVLVIAINSCVDQWVYDFKQRWLGNTVQLLDMNSCRALLKGSGPALAQQGRTVWVIPSHLFSSMKDQDVAAVVEGLEPDAVILDEIHIFKQREGAEESQRRQQTLKLLTAASDINPEMMVLGLSGTVITNSLNEGRTLLELVMGEERPDLPTGRGIAKAMRMHQALMANGIRQRANNDFPYVILRPEVDATDLLEDVRQALRYPPRLRPLQVEKALIHARLPAIVEAINGPTVIVTQYVEGFIEPLRKAIRAAGHRVGVHTGEEKLPVHGHENAVEAFKAGALDVLLASINTVSTGVDGLQNVSSNLVIASMPWTAADYLQVIARLARSGQEQPVRVVIPTTHIDYDDDDLGPAKWSFCDYRASIIACKQRLMDAVMDGLVPESEEITEAKAGQQLVKWLERLTTKGALVRPSRPIRVPLIYESEEEERKVRARFGDWSSCNGRWNSQVSGKLHQRLRANPQEWEFYHTDLESLRMAWDVDPLQEAIKHCSTSQGLVIGDFGCGTAKLADALEARHTIHSFDHVAINEKVVACDVAAGVPLPDESLDLAVFSLSLMGSNWRDQLLEAWRCLKPTGQVLIWTAGGTSSDDDFCLAVEDAGFKLITRLRNYKWLHVWGVRAM
jgi:hypothetical protein